MRFFYCYYLNIFFYIYFIFIVNFFLFLNKTDSFSFAIKLVTVIISNSSIEYRKFILLLFVPDMVLHGYR